MIEESFVTFDTAKMLKEIGFNIPVNTSYSEDGSSEYNIFPDNFNKLQGKFSRPTQALAARWLREIYKLHICVDFNHKGWYFIIYDVTEQDRLDSCYFYNLGYEEALEEGLKEALKLLKN